MKSKMKHKCIGVLSLFLAFVLSVSVLAPTAAASTEAESTDKVAYGTTNYPNLTNIDYDTYRKLDYQQGAGKNTYFYKFRNTWYAGCADLEGEDVTRLVPDRPGFYGITAKADKNIVTYKTYSELDNVKVRSVQFRTYDGLESVTLKDSGQFNVETLPNGPYALCVWFDYTQEDGKVETASIWTAVYASNGSVYFADSMRLDNDEAMKRWLAEKRNEYAADGVFQEWMAKHGGSDLKAALRLDNVTYPFYSNTKQYPNDTSKWRALAHEICPDENAGNFTKAYLLHDWMAHNLVYDQREIKDADGYPRSESLPYRWAENGGGEWTMWNTHIGVCFDFANVYAIMCRELGVPCRIVGDQATNHCYNAVYLNGRWELVDLVNSCGSAYIENTKAALKAFWDSWEGSYKADLALGFIEPASHKYKIWDHQKDQFTDVKEKLIKFDPLDRDLCTKALLQSFGGKYNH